MYPRWRGSRLVAFIEACRSLQIISWITVDLSVFERFASAQTSPPKRGSVTEKGLLVQVFGLIQTFPIGKTRAPNAAVHSLSYFPWSGDSAERLSLHASMLRAPECLYRSRNVHERPSFCHRDGNGTPSKRPRRTPSALSAGPIPRGPAPRTQKSPRRGPVRCLQGGLGKRTGPGEGSRGGGVRRPEGRAPDSSG